MPVVESYIVRRHKAVSAICTVFITYPNVIWIPWNLERLAPGDGTGFWVFFFFRIAYFYSLFYFQLGFNFRKEGESFAGRFMRNLLYTLAGCAVFVGLSYGLPLFGVQTGYVGNILLFQFFVESLLCTFIGYISALGKEQRRKEQEIERLRIENLQSRYDALANQINPHFFFNSLNGISSLVRRGDEDAALDYVSRLSDIFRYILRSDRRQLVTLGEEIEFVGAFSHVMEVRFGGKLKFDIEVDREKENMKLPVLSLLPLIENVTVHNRIDSDHRMTVGITTPADSDRVVVTNPICPKISPADTNGTGLDNLRARFRLLTGKEIKVENNGSLFCVSLPLIKDEK